jgi:D-glycero-D-manno-heptose 1,7-bisphosphate phosphatase
MTVRLTAFDHSACSNQRVEAVLFDRDGTLVVDMPYNGDPGCVSPVIDAPAALRRLRTNGIATGVITNQSGVGRGWLSHDQVAAVNGRIEQLLGPFDVVEVCPHEPEAGCSCRKPAPGMVISACERLDVSPANCVVIGDIGADVEAALAAGAVGVLVPTPVTRHEEINAAPLVASNLMEALDLAGVPQ